MPAWWYPHESFLLELYSLASMKLVFMKVGERERENCGVMCWRYSKGGKEGWLGVLKQCQVKKILRWLLMLKKGTTTDCPPVLYWQRILHSQLTVWSNDFLNSIAGNVMSELEKRLNMHWTEQTIRPIHGRQQSSGTNIWASKLFWC